MKLDWIASQQAAEQWGIIERQAQSLCSKGKVYGVVRLGHAWLIPKNSPKPFDVRTKIARRRKIGD